MNRTLKAERTRPQPKKVSSPTQDNDHSKKAIKVAVKIAINGILSTAALTALIKLVPYHFSQEAKLREIRLEVSNTEKRVNELRQNFSINFATSETDSQMSNYSPKVEPNQMRVFWQSPTPKK